MTSPSVPLYPVRDAIVVVETTNSAAVRTPPISRGTASGGYNIATAEISVNPLTGKWADDDAAVT